MNTLKFFRLELAIAAGVYLLCLKTWSQISRLPMRLRITHVTLVLLFAWTSAAGIKVFIKLIAGNLVEVFSGPNMLSLSPQFMCWFAAFYGAAGVAFFFAVFALGRFSQAARNAFLWLVLPMGSFYPLVMANLTGTAEFLRQQGWLRTG